MFGYAKLALAGLAGATLNSVSGANPAGAASLCTLSQAFSYTLIRAWIRGHRPPLQRRMSPRLHWSLTAVVYRIVLWVFALHIMAHLVAGMPSFLGFSGMTWGALWGHIVFAFVPAAVIETRGGVNAGPTRRRAFLR